MSSFASIVCGLLASHGCVERTLSVADWAVDTRERLALEKVAREVYIKVQAMVQAHWQASNKAVPTSCLASFGGFSNLSYPLKFSMIQIES